MSEISGAGDREVGRVIAVSNGRITVLLHSGVRGQVHAYPHRIAAVTQIGGYLLFPVGPGELAVGVITGASEDEAVEADQDAAMSLRLAAARRTLRLNLLGQLLEGEAFQAGVSVYPTLDTPALLPDEGELRKILEFHPRKALRTEDTALDIGTSPIYARQVVTASYNDLFSRPLGIIGNTGSGKSYTVASVIQAALTADGDKAVQAKFVILDINGEYLPAFPELGGRPPKRPINEVQVNGKPFLLPIWTFSLAELVSFFGASQASQEPVLERVVTSLREETVDPEPARKLRKVLRLVDHCRDCLQALAALAAEVNGRAVCDTAAEVARDYEQYMAALRAESRGLLKLPPGFANGKAVVEQPLQKAGLKSVAQYKQLRTGKDYSGFGRMEPSLAAAAEGIVDRLEPVFEKLRTEAIAQGNLKIVTADTPVPFDVRRLDRDALFRVAVSRFRGQERIQEYIATLRLRIHRQTVDKRWGVFIDQKATDLATLLPEMVGASSRVTVVDCSMLAHDVLPFFCAVFGRLLLEARSHAEPAKRTLQPYVLVLEEAHNYLRPKREDESPGLRLARDVFERIAKEGRKFGLSLVIASQRPSDVSPTVISQCSNFLVHRIQNPEDLDYFRKILPIGSRELLDQVPILSPGDGLVLGSAVNVPARVRIRLPAQRPESDTARPWKAWQKDQGSFELGGAAASWLAGAQSATTEEKAGAPPTAGGEAGPKE